MSDLIENCSGCGACADVCPFLTEYGTPDLILSERPEAAFHCTSCRRCDAACPLDLSPSAAFFETKRQMVRQGRAPSPVRECLDEVRGFASAGHRFPFSFYGKADTVFWPGCGLAANRPGLIARLRKIMSRHLQKRIGLVLDCCHDPVFEYGDTETACAALREISERLHKHGVRQVITGCLNCHKLLSEYLEGIEVVFILEALPPDIFKKQNPGPVYLHHPCPSSRWEKIRNAAGGLAKSLETDFKSAHEVNPLFFAEASAPLCCGSGGGLSAFDPELADRFMDRIIEEKGDRRIITYCIGCQSRFLKRGADAVHLLECLPGIKPRRTVSGPLRQWTGRFVLAVVERLKTGKFLVAFIIALLIAGGIYLNQQHPFSAEALTALLGRHPILAPLIFLGIYSIAPSLFLPSIPLTVAAGFFWGPVWGVAFSISGATIGACLPFFLSRYLFQAAVKARVSAEHWTWLQDRVIRHGWKAVAFTRLIPIFPFNLLNYLFGLTPIPFRQYLWSTVVFMLPASVAFVAFGSSLGELIVRRNVRGVVIGVIVAVCAFLLPLVLRPFFSKIRHEDPSAENGQETRKGKGP